MYNLQSLTADGEAFLKYALENYESEIVSYGDGFITCGSGELLKEARAQEGYGALEIVDLTSDSGNIGTNSSKAPPQEEQKTAQNNKKKPKSAASEDKPGPVDSIATPLLLGGACIGLFFLFRGRK